MTVALSAVAPEQDRNQANSYVFLRSIALGDSALRFQHGGEPSAEDAKVLDQNVRQSLERAVRSQLLFCREALDTLGMDIAAAHLDAEIQTFSDNVTDAGGRSAGERTASR